MLQCHIFSSVTSSKILARLLAKGNCLSNPVPEKNDNYFLVHQRNAAAGCRASLARDKPIVVAWFSSWQGGLWEEAPVGNERSGAQPGPRALGRVNSLPASSHLFRKLGFCIHLSWIHREASSSTERIFKWSIYGITESFRLQKTPKAKSNH